MSFLSKLFHWNTNNASAQLGPLQESGSTDVNPTTGLPMVGDGIGGLDVAGSPYGVDIHAESTNGFDPCGGLNSDWP